MRLTIIAAFAGFTAAIVSTTVVAAGLEEVRVGYTSIVPETLIAKDKGFIEAELKPLGVNVKWVESLGSNKTIEFLRGSSLDIGPSSLASAFLARANGTPIKYVYWTARQSTGSPILVRNDSQYKTIADLKGTKIAATPGTGPYISLIAALKKNGLTEKDVEIVSLQHPQGRVALATGRVEAWAGLDPDWAIAELQNNAKILFADTSLAGGGGIDVREQFLKDHPDVVKAVLKGFDKARIYARENIDDSIKAFATSSKIDLAVADRAFRRNDTAIAQIEARDLPALVVWGNLYKDLGSIPADTDVEKIAKETLDATVFSVSN